MQPGDHLAVLSAGAYAMSMASNYNSRPRAAEVMVDGERAFVIRERETVGRPVRATSSLIELSQARRQMPAFLARRGRPREMPSTAVSAGRSWLQRALACGQRGWKAQPLGGFSGLGTSPCTGVRARPLMWMSGIASSSMRV